MLKTLAAFAGILTVVGCASSNAPAPTHYWEGASSKPSHQYKADEYGCRGSSEAAGELSAGSAEFAAYRDCMISKGYVLRTY